MSKDDEDDQLCNSIDISSSSSTSLCSSLNQKYRTIDGSCNNLLNPHWGQANIALQRILHPIYGDGVSLPVGSFGSSIRSTSVLLPSPRDVSVTLIPDQDRPSTDHTLLLMQWGQFLDHDITHTPLVKGKRLVVDDLTTRARESNFTLFSLLSLHSCCPSNSLYRGFLPLVICCLSVSTMQEFSTYTYTFDRSNNSGTRQLKIDGVRQKRVCVRLHGCCCCLHTCACACYRPLLLPKGNSVPSDYRILIIICNKSSSCHSWRMRQSQTGLYLVYYTSF